MSTRPSSFGLFVTPVPLLRVARELPPIGSFSQTGTLGNLIHRPLPAVLKLIHRLQHCLAVLGDLGRDVLLGIALGQCNDRDPKEELCA
jgi:hypothetical protein